MLSRPAGRQPPDYIEESVKGSFARRENVGWAKARERRTHHLSSNAPRDGGHASAFALRATADKSLRPPYEVNFGASPTLRS